MEEIFDPLIPERMPGDPSDVVYVGRANFRNQARLFGIKRVDRRQHMYIIGKSGTGKSTLINNIVAQDIAAGEGLCVVDPHGELVEAALANIPRSRLADVVYFNPADTDFHIGFNILEISDPALKHLVASGLMGIFTKIWANVWSARMEYILNNAVLALLDTPNSTLLGVTRMLVDKKYRATIVANIKDPVVKAFWVNEYEIWDPKFRNEAIAPIQNKVGQFLSSAVVRNIVGQAKSTIDVFEIMNSGKILLVNLSKGRVGEDNSALLGAMLITKIQLAAMDRVRIPEEKRPDFYLFVDEFQNFATDSFASILSEARKYRLNLIVGHQYIGQLVTDTSTRVRDSIFGNVGTMIIFRVGAVDAEFLEKELTPEFTIEDMVGLPNRQIYLKMMCDGITSRPFSASTLPPFKLKDANADISEIIESSRRKYARPRAVIEEEVNQYAGFNQPAAISAAQNNPAIATLSVSADDLRRQSAQVLNRVQRANPPERRTAPPALNTGIPAARPFQNQPRQPYPSRDTPPRLSRNPNLPISTAANVVRGIATSASAPVQTKQVSDLRERAVVSERTISLKDLKNPLTSSKTDAAGTKRHSSSQSVDVDALRSAISKSLHILDESKQDRPDSSGRGSDTETP